MFVLIVLLINLFWIRLTIQCGNSAASNNKAWWITFYKDANYQNSQWHCGDETDGIDPKCINIYQNFNDVTSSMKFDSPFYGCVLILYADKDCGGRVLG